MQSVKPASSLLSRGFKHSIRPPSTSAITSVRRFHLHHVRPQLSSSRDRSTLIHDSAKKSARHSSSDSDPSNAKTSVYQPVSPQPSNLQSSSEPSSSSADPPIRYPKSSPYPRRLFQAPSPTTPIPKTDPPLPPRWDATHPSSKPAWVDEPSDIPDPTPSARQDEPAYALAFTCKPRDYECGHRAWHRVTKQGYHHGTVLIRCPGCGGRHLISDHLKIFSDESVTIEDLMKTKGELVQRGSISGNSDVEFWDDDAERRKELERAAGIQKREQQAVEEGYVK
ncbi:MAG: hypothetical protein M1822_005465 [Bathelium mastoideum]|nr:MAG: hypothetical protein M1822_005465 [Bathelium mastoideum]